MERDINSFNLDDDKFTVELRGRRGLSLKKIVTDASFLEFESTPDVVFLQIGGAHSRIFHTACRSCMEHAETMRNHRKIHGSCCMWNHFHVTYM